MQNKSEIILNGIFEEEVTRYYHICFYTDAEGPNLDNPDHFIFVPKPVCRIVDENTVAILEWYVKKKKLTAFIRGRGIRKSALRRNKPSMQRQKPMGVFRRSTM